MKRRLAPVNSTVAFAMAVLATITWHELGHAGAALGLGLSPTVYPFAVDTGGTTSSQDLVTALAGPLLSLVTGVVVLAVSHGRRPAGFWGLGVLWFGLLNVQEFAGYLITGLFFAAGDIGRALELSRAPIAVGIALFLLGWILTFFTGRYATGELLTLTDPSAPVAPQLRDLGLFAWLLGTAVAVLVSVGSFDFGPLGGAVGFFEVLGTLSIGLFLIFVRLFMRAAAPHRQPPRWSLPYAGVVVLIVLALVRQLVLGPGLSL